LLASALGAAAALGLRAVLSDGGAARVITTTIPSAPRGPALDQLLLQSQDGRTLNDAAFALINAHEYERALPLARKAARTAEKGTVTRGYAIFNLGFTLLHLGRCKESLAPLQLALKLESRSQQKFILPEIKRARACARGEASAPAP
jgi:tetratricopeptide (TPR) repeat protein